MAHQGRKALPPAKDGDTQDAFSRNWRRLLACLSGSGVVRKTRRRFHKLVRREAKKQIDMDPEARELIYKNRHKLYED